MPLRRLLFARIQLHYKNLKQFAYLTGVGNTHWELYPACSQFDWTAHFIAVGELLCLELVLRHYKRISSGCIHYILDHSYLFV